MPVEPTVFVIDDDPGMRKSLRYLLESALLTVRTFSTGGEFLEFYDPSMPGCLVLDMKMPDINGLEVIDQIAKNEWRIPTVMITGHAEVSSAVRAMKSGVLDFLEKPFREQVLLDCVRRGLARDAEYRLHLKDHQQLLELVGTLTDRETEVLVRVVAGKANKTIASEMRVSIKTVEYHRGKIMSKLGVTSVPDLVRLWMRTQSPLPPGETPVSR